MRLGLSLLVGLLVGGGCEQRNPEKCSDNNHCPDPSLPFCDFDGTVGGQPQECIAVSCTAETLEACRGDQELRCNETGSNFDVVKCELGCDDLIGCRLCEPNETRCTNGKVGVCDSDGKIVSSETCALGCFLDEPRCRDIDPSNGLGSLLDLAGADNLDLDGGYILTDTGVVKDAGGVAVSTTTALKTLVNGSTIRVFVAHNIRLKDVSIFKDQDDHDVGARARSGPAVAFLATGTIQVEGRIRVNGGAGGVVAAGCSGGSGFYEFQDGTQRMSGGGGGGHGTAGAPGGTLTPLYSGGAGGVIAGTESLIPLRGGCSSSGAAGGVQFSSAVASPSR